MSRPGTSALIISLAILSSVSAQTVIHVDIDAPPDGDGTSWTTAYNSLSAALAAAEPGDQIWVAAGRYVGRIRLALEVQLYGGFAGTETELDQRDWTTHKTIIDGDKRGSVVTSPVGAGETTRIDGFTITGGGAFYGGGLLLESSSPTIANNTITGNSGWHGGGLYLSNSDATIANNTITENTALRDCYGGGGLYLYESSPVIANNTITGNSAADSGGGLLLESSSPTIANNTITGNGAWSGGGLYLRSSAPTITNTIIALNSSGVHLEDDENTPTLRYNCVYGNAAYDWYGLPNPTGTDGNISQDPLLADARYRNVHIQPDSPCVDAGSNPDAYGNLDLDGEPRIHPVDGIVDIGADESDGTLWPTGPYAVVRVSSLGDDINDGSSWAQAKCTVQAGVDAASVLGGEVWVQSGSYEENITLRPYAYLYGGFAGDEEVRDERDWAANVTILDGRQQDSVVAARAGYNVSAIEGFTITGGRANHGGGLHVYGSSPTIANNTIAGNTGGGLYLWYSDATIANNTITGNRGSHGGGLYLWHSVATIANNTIRGNSAADSGGGLLLESSSPTIANNTITGNNAYSGGGLHLEDSFPAIANTIIAFNSSGVYLDDTSAPTLWHNCVYGNPGYDYDGLSDPTGTGGNISQDPLLADARYGNVHIQPGSPCVDAGSNPDAYGDFDVDGEPRIHPVDGIVDIGADESDGTLWPTGPYTVVRVSPLGDDINDGSSWTLAKCTVQAAVDAASVLGGDVWVQSGSYEENITLQPYAYLYGGFAGNEEVRDERDWVANATILDGRQQGWVVTAEAGHHVSAIDGFTITGGGAMYSYGGGLRLVSSSPTIANNTITGNSAVFGGGLYLLSSSPTIANNTITGNNSSDEGGGLFLESSSPTIANNTITGNASRYRSGGGLYLLSSSPTIANNTITGNSAERGGGLYLRDSFPTIANNTITGNRSSGCGGGLYLWSSSPTTANNTITSNSAVNGGGLYLYNGSSPMIANTIIALNSSGVYVYDSEPTLWYNCVYGNAEYDYDGLSDPTGTDGNISEDPLLADAQYGNVHIQPDSPCVDAGSNTDVYGDSDLDGEPRIHPADGIVDIGADESDGSLWPAGPYAVVRVSPLGDDINDGSSWALAKYTVQAAVDAASVLGGEVWVRSGSYEENITLHPYAYLYGGFAGDEDVRGERDWVANVTILDGRQQGAVVTANAGHHASAIDGFTITGGSAKYGGGLSLLHSSPTIANNTITVNSSSEDGGGLYLRYSFPTIANNTITGNSAKHDGGGLYLQYSSPTIANNTITGNTTDGSCNGGGGLYLHYSSPTIANNTITGNSAKYDGGGLRLHYSSPTIANNTITGNTASDDGGGLFMSRSSPTIANNTITGNSAADFGGGLYLWYSDATIANNTITGNSAADSGGGLCLSYSSNPTIANTIIAFNSSGVYLDDDTNAPTLWYDCVHGNAEYDYDGLPDPTGTDGNISQDPLFVRDPDDGGDGWGDDPDTPAIDEGANDDYGNLRHLPGSPCIDAADNDAVPDDTLDLDGDGDVTESIPFDLDGYTRFVDDPRTADAGNPGGHGPPVVDMGAYEFRPGDCGHDGDVDMSDYAEWESCLSGPEYQTPAECECFDVNGNDHVDLADFAVLQVNLTGP